MKQRLMAKEFEYDMKLKQMDVDAIGKKEKQIEDRKDKRTEMQATQQSKLISQRQNDLPPTNFDSQQQENTGEQQIPQQEMPPM